LAIRVIGDDRVEDRGGELEKAVLICYSWLGFDLLPVVVLELALLEYVLAD